MLNLPLIKSTFMMGGFYRVNLPQSSANVSVLAMNSISLSPKNLNTNGEQDMQLQWLEEQLASAESWRKFIISNHIYFGTQVKDNQMKALWTADYTRRFAAILERYADRIIIELSGHEHTGDVRYHEGSIFYPGSSILKGVSKA